MDVRPGASTSNIPNVEELQSRFFRCRDTAFREGLLDAATFTTLMRSSPTLPDLPIFALRNFLKHTQRQLTDLTDELGKTDPAVDLFKLRSRCWDLRIMCYSVLAKRLISECVRFIATLETKDVDQFRRALWPLRDVYARTRSIADGLIESGSQLLDWGMERPRGAPPPSL